MSVNASAAEPSYYDIPFLKPPVWSWEISSYFFLGGLSSGTFVLARLTKRAGAEPLARAATTFAFLTLLPCPPLLVADLGDPSRFHHMLRVFKPESPMNLGAWALTGYGVAVFLAWVTRKRSGAVLDSVIDAVGLPAALLVAGYTGVLLSGSSTPLWSKSPWLGPLFSASALSSGASALSLLGETGRETPASVRPALETIRRAGHLAEAVTLAGFLASKGSLARPARQSEAGRPLGLATAGLAAAEVLATIGRRRPRRFTLATAALGLLSAFALRWAVTQGGKPSAQDPHANRRATRAEDAP